jgi:hypothetical protein
MRKFKHGTLRSSSGSKVTNPAQARAIAASYGPKRKKKKTGVTDMLKKHYGGRHG